MISQSISEKILVVGPQYENHRGGIGAVINVQKDYYSFFNFIPSYQYHSNNFLKSLFFILQVGRIVRYLVKNSTIKVLHVHSSVNGSLYRKLIIILLCKYVFKKKIINHLHSGAYDVIYNNAGRLKRSLLMRYFRLSDLTFTVSQQWKEYISSQFNLKTVYFIQNIVSPAKLEEKDDVENACKLFLFLGLIGDNKGIYDLIEVIAANKEELEGRMRLIVGGNGETEKLTKLISDNQLEKLVEFRGWIDGQAKHDLLQKSDVFILPSYSEGMPVSILEAMSYGMPVISTNVGGIPEIVHSEVNGKIIKPGDRDALFESVKYYLGCPEAIKNHGSKSLSIIQEYFPDPVMSKMEVLYKSLVNG